MARIRSEKNIIKEAQTKMQKSTFCNAYGLMRSQKKEIWTKNPQVHRAHVVLRGVAVKDDGDSRAVFTEQGSSASDVTAAKVLDVILRLPGCASEAIGAVSAYTQVTKEEAVPISWMCKKQTSVSHSSAESEIISLGAGLRMDGLPALDLWDVVIEVLRSTNNTAD